MSWVFRKSRSHGAARLVLLALADTAHDSGEVSAYARSQSSIAKKANVDEKTCRRALAELVEMGELVVTEKGDGRASSNYMLPMPAEIEGGHDAPPARAVRPPREGEVTPQGGHSAPPIIPSLSVVPPSLPARLSSPASFSEIVDPLGAIAIRREAGAILDEANHRSTFAKVTSSERKRLRPVIEDALANGYDPSQIADAISTAAYRTDAGVMGELRKRHQPSAPPSTRTSRSLERIQREIGGMK